MKLNSIIHCPALTTSVVLALAHTQTFASERAGVLYIMDNAAAANHVLVYDRASDGILTSNTSVATGGFGTGSGLGSQGALALSTDGNWLFACNAGSSEISVLEVTDKGLVLKDKVASGGDNPISLTLHRNLLFVLNAGGTVGGTDNVTGFIFAGKQLQPIPNSTHGLSSTNTNPAEVCFSGDGEVLAVTEKNTSIIDTFTIDIGGSIGLAKQFASHGQEPFGFAFSGKDMIVSEAFEGAADGGAASSYTLSDDGLLDTNSATIGNGQTAPCWIAVTANGRIAYAANTGSGTITAYQIVCDDALTVLNSDGATGLTGFGSKPADLALSRGSHFLYSNNGGNGTISAFSINEDGSLVALPVVTDLPAGATGLAAQ